MKPFTVEEIKTMPLGTYIYITRINYLGENKNYGFYAEINYFSEDGKSIEIASASRPNMRCTDDIFEEFSFSNYGVDWVAYKNAEQAAIKGEWIAIPCLRDLPVLYYHDEPIYRKELIYFNKYGNICSKHYDEDEFENAEATFQEILKNLEETNNG